VKTGPWTKSRARRPWVVGLQNHFAGRTVGLCLVGWIATSNPGMAQPAVVCSHDPALANPQSSPPPDVCGGSGTTDRDFYTLSWRLFKFLVWPAAGRGIPDEAKKITDTGRRTFETFKADWEIFRPNAVEPDKWIVDPSVAEPCRNRPNIRPGELVLASFHKFGNLKEGEPDMSHLLVAQNQTYVRYQAAYNKKVFDTIVNKGLYNPDTVGRIPRPATHDPVPDAAIEPDESMTVKSAWIELPGHGPKQIDASRFYVREDAWVQEPELQTCRRATVGLVGLHIVYKTESRPVWIWSTFEHVDNVPEEGRGSGNSYTFHNGDLSRGMTPDPEPAYMIPSNKKGPGEPPRPYQVERLQKIDPEVLAANDRWQAELRTLGSVWQHYKLVLTQWPRLSSAEVGASLSFPTPRCGRRNWTATVNTTMETFLQTQQDCSERRTCMGCHDIARKTDFVFSIMFNSNKPREMRSADPRDYAIKALKDLLETKQTR
jgi:hypothetical protein